MDRYELVDLKRELTSFAVFSDLQTDEILTSIFAFLETLDRQDQDTCVWAYCSLVGKIYEKSAGDLANYILDICTHSENVYVKLIASGKPVPKFIAESLQQELLILQKIANLTAEELIEACGVCGYMPKFISSKVDVTEEYLNRVKNVKKYGYGKYSRNSTYYMDDKYNIVPIKNPDDVRLSSLVDFTVGRDKIINNTKALLSGKPAANVLLTGDAGTGKSSTVKAIQNEFFSEGLRLIELNKKSLIKLPSVLEELSTNPLKFIIFIDDISFSSDDDAFNALKAVLEGSCLSRAKNVVIYATSNRRHIVKEKFSDREGDDVHLSDTLQEMVSLSNRFGIHITFNRPNKTAFLDIVKTLAKDSGITLPEAELFSGAERLALERGGRSARLAKQYIDGLLSEI